jgi:hypothetical protein
MRINFKGKIRNILYILTLLFFSCSSNFNNISSVSDGKRLIDNKVENLNANYEKLCSEPRNDQLKERFLSLKNEIDQLYGCGEQCSKLSYKEQSELSNYAIIKLKEYKNLCQLTESGSIICW